MKISNAAYEDHGITTSNKPKIDKSLHTPGPWFIDQYGHVYGMAHTDDPTTVTSVCLIDGRHSAANVRDKILIAAAPDLLAALDGLMQYVGGWDAPEGHPCAVAVKALAKARGE